MTPERQQIAIGEACGWVRGEQTVWGCYTETYEGWEHPKLGFAQLLPDYLNDLNAMHEAEKVLGADEPCRYGEILAALVRRANPVNGFCWTAIAHATAAQRAEAFLRTIGRWEDS